MTFTPEEIAQFEQMEQELDAYGKAFEKGTKEPIPQYDDALFVRFRQWQAKRLSVACQELDDE